jgi:small neutral amino acid transporter SnatA (MarC family)
MLLVAVNPPAVVAALGDGRCRRELALAAGLAAAVATATAGLSGPVLDALDVTAPTFRVATAVVLGVAGVRWLALGPWVLPGDASQQGWRSVIAPLLVPLLVTPQLIAVSTSVGADRGVATVVLGAGVAMVLAWVAAVACPRRPGWAVASRFVGLLAVVVALALAVDGVRSV